MVAGKELAKIAKRNSGKLQPSAIVEAATPETAPLHVAFTWDDQKAAHLRRLWEARMLTRVVYIEGVSGEDPEPQYVHVETDKKEGHYRDVRILTANIEEFESALAEAKRKLVSAQRSFNRIKDLAERANDDRAALIGVILEALGTAQMTVSRIQ